MQKSLVVDFKIGDEVDIDFQNSKYLKSCSIAAIKSTGYEIYYDINIPVGYEGSIVIKDIHSVLVKEPIRLANSSPITE